MINTTNYKLAREEIFAKDIELPIYFGVSSNEPLVSSSYQTWLDRCKRTQISTKNDFEKDSDANDV